jgi:arginyl-tRNA synthetase
MTIILLSILPPPRSVSIACNSKQTTEFPWASSIEHVNYGLVLGMSTHKGTVILLEQIIREAASVMREQMKEMYAAVEDPEQTSLELSFPTLISPLTN